MSIPCRGLCRPHSTSAGSRRSPLSGRQRPATATAFTLVELLAVIAIISIIAAMVVGMSAGASRAKKEKVISAEKAKLIMFIESYHSKLGFYPPDNGNLLQLPPGIGFGSPTYEQYTATNQLLYELTGATNNVANQTFIASFDGSTNPDASFNSVYARGSVANSDPSQPQSFYNPPPNFNSYTNYPGGTAANFKGLTVPVDTAAVGANGSLQAVHLNFWHYDSSTTNRHNADSFDLWAEYFVGRDKSGNPIIITNGNW